jgi:hypothetical protein
MPWRGFRNTTYWEIWEGHTKETLSFILKILQNSRIVTPSFKDKTRYTLYVK